MKKKTHILFLLLIVAIFIMVLGYVTSVLLLKSRNNDNGSLEVTVSVEEESFTFGDGEKSTANWQACRNEVTERYNKKTYSGTVTLKDTERYQHRLKYCNTLFP